MTRGIVGPMTSRRDLPPGSYPDRMMRPKLAVDVAGAYRTGAFHAVHATMDGMACLVSFERLGERRAFEMNMPDCSEAARCVSCGRMACIEMDPVRITLWD